MGKQFSCRTSWTYRNSGKKMCGSWNCEENDRAQRIRTSVRQEQWSWKEKKSVPKDDEDANDRNIVQKVIKECIQVEKKQKTKEEEIKNKYLHLIQAEVKKALIVERYTDHESSESEEDYNEHRRLAYNKHTSKRDQYQWVIQNI